MPVRRDSSGRFTSGGGRASMWMAHRRQLGAQNQKLAAAKSLELQRNRRQMQAQNIKLAKAKAAELQTKKQKKRQAKADFARYEAKLKARRKEGTRKQRNIRRAVKLGGAAVGVGVGVGLGAVQERRWAKKRQKSLGARSDAIIRAHNKKVGARAKARTKANKDFGKRVDKMIANYNRPRR